jgi:hypothetical protein
MTVMIRQADVINVVIKPENSMVEGIISVQWE